MLITVFGVAGSGKSYFVTKNYIIDRLNNGYCVVSNIELNNKVFTNGDYVFLSHLSMKELNSKISLILKSDGDIEAHAQNLAFLFRQFHPSKPIIFIIDECHLFGWSGRSSIDNWADAFVSIHRHIMSGFDIVLITQVSSRLNREIANQAEIAVKAIPASQRLFTKRLEYKIFSSVDALSKNDKTMLQKTESYQGNPKVFDFYISGFAINGSDSLRKKMYMILLGIVLLVFYIIYSFSTLITPPPSTLKKEINKKVITDNNVSHETNQTNYFYANQILCKKISNNMNSDYLYKTSKEVCYLIPFLSKL